MKKMLSSPIFRFLGMAFLLFTLMLALIGVGDSKKNLRHQFTAFGNLFFSEFSDNGKIEFKDNTKKGTVYTILTLYNQKEINIAKAKARSQGKGEVNVGAANFNIDTWQYVFFPLCFLWSLVLASPVSWKKRMIGFVIANILFALFVYLKLYVEILYFYNERDFLDVALLNPFWKKLTYGFHAITFSLSFNLIVCVFIWLVTVGKSFVGEFLNFEKVG